MSRMHAPILMLVVAASVVAGATTSATATAATAAAAAATAAAAAPAAGGADPERRLPADAALADVALVRHALEQVHPGWGRFTAPAAIRAELDRLDADIRAEPGIRDGALLVRLGRVLALMRCDHTKAEAPASLREHRERHPTHLPFLMQVRGDRAFVRLVHPEAAADLRPGDEVLAIDGRPLPAILDAVRPLLSVDGWTDRTKDVELGWSTEMLGGGVDHFGPLLRGWPGPERRVRIRRAEGGATEEIVVPGITLRQARALASDSANGSGDFEDSVAFRMLGPTTGLLEIGTFINYRTDADPVAVLGPHFRRLAEADADHLIIDLRSCGGGSDEVPATLLSYLIDEPLIPGGRLNAVRTVDFGPLRPHLRTWDPAVFEIPAAMLPPTDDGFLAIPAELDPTPVTPIAPRPVDAGRFTGRVTVLIGPANASGATSFLALLRAHRPNVRYVGEPTGGNAEGPTAGIIAFLDLPASGIVVRLPLLRQWNNAPPGPVGVGIAPDRRVAPARPGVEGDPVLAAALSDTSGGTAGSGP